MAKQDKVILSGKIGNLIFYSYNGGAYARSASTNVKQTKASEVTAGHFAKAASLCKSFRHGLSAFLPDEKDRNMMHRFDYAFRQWLYDNKPEKNKFITGLPFIEGFQFNKETSLTERLKVKLSIDWNTNGKIIITIPQLNPSIHIIAPAYTQSVRWRFAAISCGFAHHTMTGYHDTEIEMPYEKTVLAARQIQMPFTLKAGDITLITASLRYTAFKKGTSQVVGDKSWLPADVVDACYGKPK